MTNAQDLTASLHAKVVELIAERDAALARLAEIEKQGPVGYAEKEHLRELRVANGMSVWCESTKIWGRAGDPSLPSNLTPIFAAAGASPEPSALQAENAKLITALAECRDAFPVPDAGSRLDDWYCSAMADPLQVPEYVKACVGASPVQPSQGLQSVADALTIEQLNDKVERLMAGQPSQDADPNAPWLTEAHMLCTDQGVPQGNISWRIQVLRELLVQPSQAGELSDTEALNFMELDRGNRVLSIGTGWYSRSSYGKPLKRVGNLRDAIIAAINAKGAS